MIKLELPFPPSVNAIVKTRRGEPKEYLENVVMPFEGDECLFWPYATDTGGRGQIWVDGKKHIVSRLVCLLAHGPPPSDRHDASHSCGMGHKGCSNKKHLSWKTKSENQSDRLAHGTDQFGEKNSMSKLSIADVEVIRSLRGDVPQRVLAEKYGVRCSTISRIQAGKRWAAQ